MVQTSPKHQENPSKYLIYRPLLQIITNRPPCRHYVRWLVLVLALVPVPGWDELLGPPLVPPSPPLLL